MNLEETLHQHQVAAIKAGLAGRENERQNQFEQIILCAQRMREQQKGEAETSRMSDA